MAADGLIVVGMGPFGAMCWLERSDGACVDGCVGVTAEAAYLALAARRGWAEDRQILEACRVADRQRSETPADEPESGLER